MEQDIARAKKIAAGDNVAFKDLFDEFGSGVLNLCYAMVRDRFDAEDIMQEVFVEIFCSIKSYRGNSKLSTWIYRIAYNHTINFIKSKSRRMSKNNTGFEESILDNLPSDIMFETEKFNLTLQKAILSLPPKQRAVFQMRYYDELTFAQISQITKTSQGALKASYHIAAQKIEDYIKEHDIL